MALKYTLLKVVQKTVDAIDSDSVNSIADTEESRMITGYVEEVYNELIVKLGMQSKEWGKLESLSDAEKPNYLKAKKGTYGIKEIWYNDIKIPYISQEEYIAKHVTNYSDTKSNGLGFKYETMPSLCTSFNDSEIVFNGVNTTEGNTLMGENSGVYQYIIPVFEYEDSFIIPIPEDSLPVFMAEVKRMVFSYLKDKVSHIDEENAKQGLQTARFKDVFDINTETKTKYGR